MDPQGPPLDPHKIKVNTLTHHNALFPAVPILHQRDPRTHDINEDDNGDEERTQTGQPPSRNEEVMQAVRNYNTYGNSEALYAAWEDTRTEPNDMLEDTTGSEGYEPQMTWWSQTGDSGNGWNVPEGHEDKDDAYCIVDLRFSRVHIPDRLSLAIRIDSLLLPSSVDDCCRSRTK